MDEEVVVVAGSDAFPTDAELVTRLQDGDEAAFAALLDAWSGGMLRTARAFVVNNEAAEDVVQETWLAVVRSIDRFEGRSSLRTWVYRILVNTAKTRAAKDSRTIPWSSLTAADAGPVVDPQRFQGPDDPYPGHWRRFPAALPSPESQIVAREVQRIVEAALAELPYRQRVVITLRDVEGYGAEEVCSILEISATNQRVLLHRARAVVRTRLEEYLTTSPNIEGAWQ